MTHPSFAGGWPARSTPMAPVLAIVLALPASADAETRREHGAHEHGAAQLDIVLDGASVHIDLDTPTANLLGFEHAPGDETQHQARDAALEALQDGSLFAFDGDAGCALTGADVALPHGDRNDDHDEHDDRDEAAGHSDTEARYRYGCERPDRLTRLETRLFTRFAGFEVIDVQLAGPGGQSAIELDADEPTSALDADARDEFLALLFAEVAAAGSTLLFVSHDRGIEGGFDRSVDLVALNRATQPDAAVA